MKTCRKCHQQKNPNFCFHADHRKADGLATICRDCAREEREHFASTLRRHAREAGKRWAFGHVGLPGEL